MQFLRAAAEMVVAAIRDIITHVRSDNLRLLMLSEFAKHSAS